MAKDRIPKGYADTPNGQVHFRKLGTGSRAIVLIHWLPLSSRMYAALMPLLAAQGFTVFAVDLLGYGRSDPRPQIWSMAAWADSVVCAAQFAGIDRAAVLGGHSGSCVATELALEHPDFTTHVVLDGFPFLTSELRVTFAAMRTAPRPAPSADGAHERHAFSTVLNTYRYYLPGYEVSSETLEQIWPAMIDYLEADFVSSAVISANYELAERMRNIKQPALLLGAQTDTLAASFPRACELLPGASTHFFPGHHPIHSAAGAAIYAGRVAQFLLR